MVRIVLIVINIFVVFSLNLFKSEEVKTHLEVPETVQAGEEFTVKVTIDKGNISGFSRFQQNIPAGLKASSLDAANADFSFTDNRVRLMWLMLPKKEKFTLSYKVKVDERLKGRFDIGGSFAYIENNKRQSVSTEQRTININPSPNIDPDLIVDIKDFKEKVIPDLRPKLSAVNCIRQKPTVSAKSDEIYVNVLVHKKGVCKFAKIEESVPPGYTAVNVENQSGIFTFKNQTVKYLWMNLPPDERVVVTYKLIPKPEIDPSRLQLSGTFSYIEENRTKSINIVQRDVDVKSLGKDEISRLYADAEAELSQPVEIIDESQTPEDTQVEEKTEEPVVEEPVQQKDEPEKTEVSNIRKMLDSDNMDRNHILDPETGVYYRVQLAAGHRPVNISRYFSRYNIKREVKFEQHEGWLKYSIGSFHIYKEARDYRNYIWDNTIIDDAFVSAYNSGVRITVQEALMITNQQWYR